MRYKIAIPLLAVPLLDMQRAMSPVKEYIQLPKMWVNIVNGIGSSIDLLRYSTDPVIPLFGEN